MQFKLEFSLKFYLFDELKRVFDISTATDGVISFGYLLINLTMFYLNIIINLFTLNSFTIEMNFTFYLNLLKTLPCR